MARELYHVPVSRLRADYWPEQMRAGTVERALAHYRKYGQPFRPIMVDVDPDGVFWIIDGRHRWEAAKRFGRRTIRADVWCDNPAFLGRMRRARDWYPPDD